MANEVEQLTPYGGENADKRQQVRSMFDNIAPAYDFMNRAMTMRLDTGWRRRTVRLAAVTAPKRILDLATGTGDLAIALARRLPQATVVAADLAPEMLRVAQQKIERHGLRERISAVEADGTALPFASDSFDCATIAFGIRNFASIDRGYAELFRVLRPGGVLLVLELATPVNPIARTLYDIYTRTLVPLAGRLVSGDAKAYSYLPRSISRVPQRHSMLRLIEAQGFTKTAYYPLTMGSAILYTAFKPESSTPNPPATPPCH